MADEDRGGAPRANVSRRGLLTGAATAGLSVALTKNARAETSIDVAEARTARTQLRVRLRVNGQNHTVLADPRTNLLDALRDQVRLTGTKKGCNHGQCGACTVHIDGKRVLSCLTFAVMAEGQDITTIEGLANPTGNLHPMQQAFIDHDAFQCGYCTPGQIMSAIACVNEGHADSPDQIREYMSGNLCRCAAYPNIVAAVQQAKTQMQGA